MFNKVVMPVALYGCETWGACGCEIVSRVQLKYYKYILKLNKNTNTNMLLGEVGQLPMAEHIRKRVLNYWFKIVTCKNESKLTRIMYKLMLSHYNTNGNCKSGWLSFVKKSLDELGLSFIWLTQGSLESCHFELFKDIISRQVKDQFVSNWRSKVNDSTSCTNYRLYKVDFECERYLKELPTFLAISMLKFKCRNVKLPVVVRQYDYTLDSNICTLCDSNDVADEFHVLLKCTFFNDERKKLLGKSVFRHANTLLFSEIMNTNDTGKLANLGRFMKIIASVHS